MWESLARTARQDRVLHGAAKAAERRGRASSRCRCGCSASGSRDPFRRLLARLDAEPRAAAGPAAARALDGRPDGAIWRRSRTTSTTPRRRGAQGARRHLELRPRPAARGGQPRLPLSGPVLGPRLRGRRRRADRGQRSASRRAPGRPGLIVVHGLFSSRRFDYVRQIAVRAYYEWGFNVLALDLRSFGLTNLTSQAPTTAGWKEGEDIVAAGRYLKELGATTVGALGISLGGVLGARRVPPGGRRARRWTAASSRSPRPRTRGRWRSGSRGGFPAPIRPTCSTARFWAMLTRASAQARWEGIEDFVDPVERVSAPYYGVEPEELWRRASAKEHIAAARVPVLVLHPEDDDVIPVEHARMLAEAARGQRAGSRLDPARRRPRRDRGRRSRVVLRRLRGFFERWAGYGSGRRRRRRARRGPLAVQADLLRREVTRSGERHPQKADLDRARGRALAPWRPWPRNRVAAVIWGRVFNEEPPE